MDTQRGRFQYSLPVSNLRSLSISSGGYTTYSSTNSISSVAYSAKIATLPQTTSQSLLRTIYWQIQPLPLRMGLLRMKEFQAMCVHSHGLRHPQTFTPHLMEVRIGHCQVQSLWRHHAQFNFGLMRHHVVVRMGTDFAVKVETITV